MHTWNISIFASSLAILLVNEVVAIAVLSFVNEFSAFSLDRLVEPSGQGLRPSSLIDRETTHIDGILKFPKHNNTNLGS